jgi:CheY-like chemotaxis protein
MWEYFLGQHALTQFQERPYEVPYDVIVCDLHMPGLNGPAFSTLLSRQYPALRQRVIVLTGDSGSTASQRFLAQCGRPWLPKPCPIAMIRRAIQHVLQASPPA